VTSYQRSRARSAHMTRTTGCTPPAHQRARWAHVHHQCAV